MHFSIVSAGTHLNVFFSDSFSECDLVQVAEKELKKKTFED